MSNDQSFNKLNGTLTEIGTAFESFRHDIGTRLGNLEADNQMRSTETLTRPGGLSGSRENREFLTAVMRRDPQMAVTVGTATAGGNAAPEELAKRVWSQALKMNPIISEVYNFQSETGDISVNVTDDQHGYEWVGETDTRNETTTAVILKSDLTAGTVSCYPKVSEEAAMDIHFDVEAWFIREASRAFSKAIGAAILTGNGTSKPTGLLNATPSTTPDTGASPRRAYPNLEYIPVGSAASWPSDFAGGTASPIQDATGPLYDVIFALNSEYRRNAKWCMNSATMGVLAKLRDSEGRHIWQPSLSQGQPSTLCGYPIIICEDCPDVATNSYPVLFGDFDAGYALARIGPMRVTVDSSITSPGWIKLYSRTRVAGAVADSNSVKCIKIATS